MTIEQTQMNKDKDIGRFNIQVEVEFVDDKKNSIIKTLEFQVENKHFSLSYINSGNQRNRFCFYGFQAF